MFEYQSRLTVQWGDCDPAGIVYFAHFFDMFNAAVEDWFDAGDWRFVRGNAHAW